VCAKDDQCCQTQGTTHCLEDPKGFKAKRCKLDGPGVTCLADGSSCALASRCCSGHCLPNPSGGYSCASTCSDEGQPCTSRADCAGAHSDCLVIEGKRACHETVH
jgi:hypothetical protein